MNAAAAQSQSKLEREGIGALAIAALAPAFWMPLFLLSIGLVLVAFVIGVLSIVRSRPIAGILLICGCPIAAIFALAAL